MTQVFKHSTQFRSSFDDCDAASTENYRNLFYESLTDQLTLKRSVMND